jgi:hypothetical protein
MLDGYTSEKHNTLVLFTPSAADAAIVANLAPQIQSILLYMNGLFPQRGLV